MATYVFIHGLGQDASAWDKTLSLRQGAAPVACPQLFALPKGRELTYETLYLSLIHICPASPKSGPRCGWWTVGGR